MYDERLDEGTPFYSFDLDERMLRASWQLIAAAPRAPRVTTAAATAVSWRRVGFLTSIDRGRALTINAEGKETR